MPNTRVGSLDHPQRYDKRSVAVYANGAGLRFKLDGRLEKVHGNTLWTTLGNVKMRGNAPAGLADDGPGGYDWDERDWDERDWDERDWDEQEIAAAIATSLEDSATSAWDPMPVADGPIANGPIAAPAGDAPNDDRAGNEDHAGNQARSCAICLSEQPIMLMRPCNHICACETCAPRLVRRPCVMCRRVVKKVERVYF